MSDAFVLSIIENCKKCFHIPEIHLWYLMALPTDHFSTLITLSTTTIQQVASLNVKSDGTEQHY